MGLISNGDKSVAFMGEAVQPERQKHTGMLVQVRTGVDLLSSSEENPVILGGDLAKSLNARPGDVLTIMTTTADGALNGADVIVAGTYSTGLKEADSRILSVRLTTAQRLLASDRVTKLAISLDGTENTEQVKREIERILRQNHLHLEIRTWSELSMTYRQVIAVFSAVFAVLSLIIFVLVVLSSSNTMMMAVFERVQEIGTMMALGTSRICILGLFLLEGLFFGIIGGTVSVVLAWSLSVIVNRAKIQLPPMPMNTDGFPIIIRQLPEVFIGVFLLAVFMMVLGAVLPALRGSRLKIVDALGHI
jgi:putative ABC transport system permease protein